MIEEIEEYLEREELAELTRKREWEQKYGVDPGDSQGPSRRNSESSDSSDEETPVEKSNSNSNNTKKHETSNNSSNNKDNNNKRNSHDMGEPHHSSDYNSRSSGKLLKIFAILEQKKIT